MMGGLTSDNVASPARRLHRFFPARATSDENPLERHDNKILSDVWTRTTQMRVAEHSADLRPESAAAWNFALETQTTLKI